MLQWLHGVARLHAEGQSLFGGVDDHPLIVAHLPADDELGKRRFDVGLQVPLERTGPVVRIVGGIPNELVGGLGQFQRDLALLKPLLEPTQLEVDDLADLLGSSGLNSTVSSTRFRNSA